MLEAAESGLFGNGDFDPLDEHLGLVGDCKWRVGVLPVDFLGEP